MRMYGAVRIALLALCLSVPHAHAQEPVPSAETLAILRAEIAELEALRAAIAAELAEAENRTEAAQAAAAAASQEALDPVNRIEEMNATSAREERPNAAPRVIQAQMRKRKSGERSS